MEYSYSDIEIIVRHANQQRSYAMGEILSLGWKNFKQMLGRLAQHVPHPHGHLSHS